MDARSQSIFLALISAQAAHSAEEYAFGLYEVFAPARFVSGLLSRDLATGFIVANAALLLFGLWCYLARVRAGRPTARWWAWLWVLLECGNGSGHLLIALARGGYFPGVFTAPALLALSIILAWRLAGAGDGGR
jgi:hypothetical protein